MQHVLKYKFDPKLTGICTEPYSKRGLTKEQYKSFKDCDKWISFIVHLIKPRIFRALQQVLLMSL